MTVYVVLVTEGPDTAVYSVYQNKFDATNEAANLRVSGQYLDVQVVEAELE